MIDINSIEGLKLIKEKAEFIFVRIKRDKWLSIAVGDLNALELLDILIMWVEQGRKIQ